MSASGHGIEITADYGGFTEEMHVQCGTAQL